MRIHFKDMQQSPALVADIEARVGQLAQIFPRIVDVRVNIEGGGRAHNGRAPWVVSVDAVIPGAELVVHASHDTDVYAAVHAALAMLKRDMTARSDRRVHARKKLSVGRRGGTTSSAGSSRPALVEEARR